MRWRRIARPTVASSAISRPPRVGAPSPVPDIEKPAASSARLDDRGRAAEKPERDGVQHAADFDGGFSCEGPRVRSFEHDPELEAGHHDVPVERVEISRAAFGVTMHELLA